MQIKFLEGDNLKYHTNISKPSEEEESLQSKSSGIPNFDKNFSKPFTIFTSFSLGLRKKTISEPNLTQEKSR